MGERLLVVGVPKVGARNLPLAASARTASA
jgi:hypothetical protein